ncbi:MAG: zinc ribbon domain-containing protein [Clostridium sp.]|uniref:zinc ribbon domain-containing protein n=1 Tax=Clostridium sp. TaxID=1506 RepID=UPI003D6D2A6D
MKFCTKCGHEVKEEKLFCTFCGNNLSKENINEDINETLNKIEPEYDNNSTTITSEKSPVSNFKVSKKSKIAMVLIAILIITVIAVVKVGNSLSDPNRLVTRFEKAVASNNVSDLATIMYSTDSRLKIDSKSITPLLSYFKSNPSYFNDVIQKLKEDALTPKDINSLSIASSNTLTLASKGKTFFIFPNYKISIKPSFIDITTTVKDVTFSINNTQIGKSDTDKSTKQFGPYIPGTYSVLANYKGKYITLSKPYPVDLVSTSNGISKLNVFDDMTYLNISSDYSDAQIFVDGKNVNVKVKDANAFGPIDSSTKIYATYVNAGKTLKSEEYSASNGTVDLHLSFQHSKDAQSNVENQLKDLLRYYTSYFTEAVNTNNVSLINPYVASGSSLYKEQQLYIPKTFAAGIKESIISADITDYSISDDSKSGSVTASEVYTIVAKDGTSSNKSFKYVYKFLYNDSTSSYQFTSIK